MKKLFTLCLLLSTFIVVHAQTTLTLNKDDQTIIDPTTGNLYELDQDSQNNQKECQEELGSDAGYFFNQDKTIIINAANCFRYALRDVPLPAPTDKKPTNTPDTDNNQTPNTTNDTPDTNDTNTNKANTLNNTTSNNHIANSNQTEQQNAIAWLHSIGGTIFGTEETFNPNGLLLREQASKFFSQSAEGMGYTAFNDSLPCNFEDINKAATGLVSDINKACKQKLFKGHNNFFNPKDNLTMAHLITVGGKILQNGEEFVNDEPWPRGYYNRMNAIGVLDNLTTQDQINEPATRGKAAILLYRLHFLTQKADTENIIKKEDKISTDILVNTSGLGSQVLSFEEDPEFVEAIGWMRDLQMTSRKTVNDFMPLGFIQKQHAAQFLSIFHQTYFTEKENGLPDTCFFQDLNDANTSFRSHIIYSCKEGILQGENGYFNPTTPITQADFIAGLINMLDVEVPKANEGEEYREPYFSKALELGIVTSSDKAHFTSPITRYKGALLLYRKNIRYKFLQDLEKGTSNKISEVISVINEDEENDLDPTQSKIALDTNSIFTKEGRLGIIQLEENNTYTLQKEKAINIYDNSINWFGSLYDTNTNEKQGNVNFLLNANTHHIINGTIRTADATYTITPSNITSAYYIMTRSDNGNKAD